MHLEKMAVLLGLDLHESNCNILIKRTFLKICYVQYCKCSEVICNIYIGHWTRFIVYSLLIWCMAQVIAFIVKYEHKTACTLENCMVFPRLSNLS